MTGLVGGAFCVDAPDSLNGNIQIHRSLGPPVRLYAVLHDPAPIATRVASPRRPPLHVVFFLELPRLAAVTRFLSTPGERVRLDLIERPSNGKAISIGASKNDPVAFQPPLNLYDVVALRTDEDHSPLLERRIEESHGRTDGAIRCAIRWVSDPDVLQRPAVQDPAE